MRHRCMLCDKPLHGTAWLCHECAQANGLDIPFRQWPAWAKELKRLEQATRRFNQLRAQHESKWPLDGELWPHERGLSYAWRMLVEIGVESPDYGSDRF